MGAPQNPIDGTKYAELLLGVPMVLEYDSSTGGFKLVIDVENTLEVTFTGVTIDVEDNSTYDAQNRLNVRSFVTGTVDTELPPAVLAANGLANPTAPSVLAHLMGSNGATWDVVYMGLSGSVSVDLVTQLDTINDEVTAYITGSTSLNLMGKTIVRAVIDVSGSAAGEQTLVAAVGGQKIKVLETMLIGNADVSVFFQSGFTGTALTGPMSLPSDGDGFFVGTPAQIEAHHFETIAGEALVLDIDANVLLGGWINYYTEA